MANLSNINNKFIVTDGNNGRVLIGATNDIGATLFANHPSTTAPSLTFNAPAGQVFENEDLQFAFGLNNASPYNGYMQTRFVSAPYYRNLAINPLGGDVGIGTNSPSNKLQVNGDVAIDTSTNCRLRFYQGGTFKAGIQSVDTGGQMIGSSAADDLAIRSQSNMLFSTGGNTERMRITNGGNVVINYNGAGGVVDPSYSKFTVATQPPYNLANSQINPTTATFVSDKMTNNDYNSILQLVSVRTSLTSGQNSNGYLGFSTLDNSNGQGVIDAGRIAIVNENGVARNSPTALSFWTNTPNGNVSNTSATERMRITSGGNVGIGYTNPVYKLQVLSTKTVATNIGMYSSAQGASTSNYSFYADANGATNNWAFYAASGNSYFANGIRLGGNGSSNELDDYEEGTWTPTSNLPGATVSSYGKYTKIGNIVYIAGKIEFTGKTGTAVNVVIDSLPFSGSNTSDTQTRPSAFPEGDLVNMATLVNDYGHFRLNSNQMQGVIVNSSGNTIYMSSNNFSSSGQFNFSVVYTAT